MQKTLFKKFHARAKEIIKKRPSMPYREAYGIASKQIMKEGGAKVGVVKKKIPIKKIEKKYHQTGSSSKYYDEAKKAKLPGKRKSASRKIYFENRKNRSDMPNSLTGISQAKLMGEIRQRVEGTMGKAYVDLNKATKAAEKKALKKIISECKIKLRKLK